jgi:hypothetical protein
MPCAAPRLWPPLASAAGSFSLFSATEKLRPDHQTSKAIGLYLVVVVIVLKFQVIVIVCFGNVIFLRLLLVAVTFTFSGGFRRFKAIAASVRRRGGFSGSLLTFFRASVFSVNGSQKSILF